MFSLSQNLSDGEDSNYTESGEYVSAEQSRTAGTLVYLFRIQSSQTFMMGGRGFLLVNQSCKLIGHLWPLCSRGEGGGWQQPNNQTQTERCRKDQIRQRTGEPVGAGSKGRWANGPSSRPSPPHHTTPHPPPPLRRARGHRWN